MSKKTTISRGDGFHLYRKDFDDARVYLELEKAELETNPDRMTVAIPVRIWEHITQSDAKITSQDALANKEGKRTVESIPTNQDEAPPEILRILEKECDERTYEDQIRLIYYHNVTLPTRENNAIIERILAKLDAIKER